MAIKPFLYLHDVCEYFYCMCVLGERVFAAVGYIWLRNLTECMTCALLVLTCICVSATSNTHMIPAARTSSLPLFHCLFLPLCAGFYCMPLLFKLFLPPFSSIFLNPSPRAHCVCACVCVCVCVTVAHTNAHTRAQNADLDRADGDRIHFFPRLTLTIHYRQQTKPIPHPPPCDTSTHAHT